MHDPDEKAGGDGQTVDSTSDSTETKSGEDGS